MNAVAVFIALLFFGWLWGGWGLLVGVPLLAIMKTTVDRIPSLDGFATLLADNRPVAPTSGKA
jgi:predicted PurR-regulated permease PerM